MPRKVREGVRINLSSGHWENPETLTFTNWPLFSLPFLFWTSLSLPFPVSLVQGVRWAAGLQQRSLWPLDSPWELPAACSVPCAPLKRLQVRSQPFLTLGRVTFQGSRGSPSSQPPYPTSAQATSILVFHRMGSGWSFTAIILSPPLPRAHHLQGRWRLLTWPVRSLII